MNYTRTFTLLLPALLLLAASGCSRTPAELRERAVRAEAEARKAFERHDADAAGHAAECAEAAAQELERRAKSGKLTGADARNLLNEAGAAAASAREFAQLADEDHQCRERLASLKLKAYRHLRGAVCSYGLAGLAPVAEHAAAAGSNSLSSAEQPLASLAWNLMDFTGVRASLTNGTDWTAVSGSLRAWSTNPPPELGMVLALGFALSGLTDFALCEVESVDAAKLTVTNTHSLYHLERGALFALNGWDKTALRELDQAARLAPEGWNGFGSTQAVALCHVYLADKALRRGQLRQADLEIARAIKAWPDNPLMAFLTGEKLAANGEWVKAADSLEAQAAGTKNEWLAKRLAQRAREFRESKGNTPGLFSDPAFILEVMAQAISESTRDSAALKKLQQLVDDARALGARAVEKLPGVGAREQTVAEEPR
jgi:hypothetical protein